MSMPVKIQDCREITIEEAVHILCDNPSGFIERYDFETTATTRLPGVFVKTDYSDFMDQVALDDEAYEYYTSIELLKLFNTKKLYTQTDEYLSVVTVEKKHED